MRIQLVCFITEESNTNAGIKQMSRRRKINKINEN